MKAYPILLILLVLPCGLSLPQDPGGDEAKHAAAAEDYFIGIEDVLSVVVWNEPDLSLNVTVRPDGKITLPLIDDINVAGLTPLRVRDLITERLSNFIREPSVTVIVAEINSFRVFVLGEVNQQGVINFGRPPRLLQAIATAGGLTPYSKKEALLLREQHGVEKRIMINLKPLLTGNPDAENLPLRSNDTIIVN